MIKKIGGVAGTDILVKGLSYMLLPIYLGMMPQEDFGQFSFIVAFLSPIFLIFSFSLYVPFIKNYCSEGFTQQKELISTIFCSLFLWLLIIDIFFIILKPFFLKSFADVFEIMNFIDEKYYLVVLLMNTGTILLYCYSFLLARKNVIEIIVYMIGKFILITFFSLTCLYLNIFDGESVISRLIGVSIAECLCILLFIVIILRKNLIFKIDFILLQKNMKLALPLVPLTMITFMIVMVDRTLIAEHHGLKVLASYGLAMVFLSPIQMIMTSIQTIWAPQLYSMSNEIDAFKKSTRIMFLSLVGMITGVAFLSLLTFLTLKFGIIGMDYSNVPIMVVMGSAGAMASSLTHLNSNMFVYLDKTAHLSLISILVLSINLSLNAFLIPAYSFYGAAFAAAVANIIGLILGFFLVRNLVYKTEVL